MRTVNKKLNKAQAWGIDLVIATAIFTIGFTLFYFFSINQTTEGQETIEKLFYDGELMTKVILSEGYPQNWKAENVISLGVTNNNKLNKTKLEKWYNMTKNMTNYTTTKAIFNTKYDYYMFLDEDISVSGTTIDGIGKPNVNRTNATLDAVNLIKVSRLTIYENKPITLYLYVWE